MFLILLVPDFERKNNPVSPRCDPA